MASTTIQFDKLNDEIAKLNRQYDEMAQRSVGLASSLDKIGNAVETLGSKFGNVSGLANVFDKFQQSAKESLDKTSSDFNKSMNDITSSMEALSKSGAFSKGISFIDPKQTQAEVDAAKAQLEEFVAERNKISEQISSHKSMFGDDEQIKAKLQMLTEAVNRAESQGKLTDRENKIYKENVSNASKLYEYEKERKKLYSSDDVLLKQVEHYKQILTQKESELSLINKTNEGIITMAASYEPVIEKVRQLQDEFDKLAASGKLEYDDEGELIGKGADLKNEIAQLEENNKLSKQAYEYVNGMVEKESDLASIQEDIKRNRNEENALIKKGIELNEKMLSEEQERLEKERNAALEKQRKTPQGALSYSSTATTLEQDRQAIKYLTEAREKLDRNDNNYKQTLEQLNAAIKKHKDNIDEVTGKTRQLHNENSKLIPKLKELAGAIGIAYGIQGIANFTRKVVEVTGEFELQQTALASIIQDANKAQSMFSEIQNMALVSPYSIQQLVSYNKQLSAYRIETEQLLPTLKKLGDVASGVGVDMQRLILAYGQVRAANYLRGQELRQFSEAGINILGELADKFSEVEGRVVSTGEVFERVSKRMVKFEDVAEVFDRLTEKGGIFYNMQAKQAETVKGQIMNLKDAWQMLLYDIGGGNSDTIKGTISMLKNIMANAERIVKVLSFALKTVVAYNVAMGVSAVVTGKTAKEANLLGKAFLSIKGMNPYVAAITAALAALAGIIERVVKHQRKLKEIEEESINTTNTINSAFEDFRKTVNSISGELNIASSVKVEKDQLVKYTEQLKKLFLDLSSEGIAITPSIEIDENYSDNEELAQKIADWMIKIKQRAAELENQKSLAEQFYEDSKSSIWTWFIQKSTMRDKEEYVNFEQNLKEYSSSMQDFKTELMKHYETIRSEFENQLGADSDMAEEINNTFEMLSGGLYSSESEVTSALNNIISKTEYLNKDLKSTSIITKYINNLTYEWNKHIEQTDIAFDNIYSSYLKLNEISETDLIEIKADPEKAKKFAENFMQYADAAFRAGGKRLSNSMWNEILLRLEEEQQLNPFVIQPLMSLPEDPLQSTKKELSEWQNLFNEFVDKQKERAGFNSMKYFGDAITDVATTREEKIKSLKEEYKELNTEIEQFNKAAKEQKAAWGDFDVSKAQKGLQYIKAEIEYLGGSLDEKKGRSAAENIGQEVNDALRFLTNLYKKAKELNKDFDKDTKESFIGVIERIKSYYKDEFENLPKSIQDAIGGSIENIEFMTPEGIVSSIEKLAKYVESNPAKYGKKLRDILDNIYKAAGDMKIDIDVELKKGYDEKLVKQIEDLFADYEVGVELKKLGISAKDAKTIFNLDAVDLSELESKVYDMREKFIGKDAEKKYADFINKLQDINDKAQLERLKKYSKYLQEEMSERVKIEIETMKMLAEVDAQTAFSPEQKSRIKTNIKEEQQKKLYTQEWKEFQQSDIYVELFGDIERASTEALMSMIKKLEQYKDSLKDLSATELKTVEGQLNQLKEQIRQNNPFLSLKYAIEEYRNAVKSVREDADIKELFPGANLKNINKFMRENIVSLGEQLSEQREITKEAEKQYQLANQRDLALSNLSKYDLFYSEEAGVDPIDEYISQLEYAKKKLSESQEGTDEYNYWQVEANQIQTIVDNLTLLEEALEGLGENGTKSAKELGDAFDDAAKKEKTLSNANSKLIKLDNALTEKQKSLIASFNKASDEVANLKEHYENVVSYLQMFDETTNDTAEAWEEFGSTVFDTIIGILSLFPTLIVQSAATGTAVNASLGIIGLIAEAVNLIIQLLKAVAQLNDNLIQVKIDKIKDSVDKLADKYEKLSRAFDDAYDIDRIRTFNAEMQYSTQQQIAGIEQMIKLEQDKKKTDKEQIEQWNKDIEDLNEQLAENAARFYEKLGGFGSEANYKSAAEEFVNAWYDAFMETGDGLSGLEETFDGFLENAMKKQLLHNIASRYFQNILEEFDELLGKPGGIEGNQAAWNEYLDNVQSVLFSANEELSSAMQMMQSVFGVGGGLEGLQQGIQGMTENTAEAITAYLNSIRMFVAQQNEAVYSLLNSITSTADNNGILANIRLVATNTSAIQQLFSSVIQSGGHPLGGAGIRVFID